MFFAGLSVCVIMASAAWALCCHGDDGCAGPLALFVLGVAIGIGRL